MQHFLAFKCITFWWVKLVWVFSATFMTLIYVCYLYMEEILDSILLHFCILLVSSVWRGMISYIACISYIHMNSFISYIWGAQNNKNWTLEHLFWKFKLLKLYWGINFAKKNLNSLVGCCSLCLGPCKCHYSVFHSLKLKLWVSYQGEPFPFFRTS